MDGAMDCSSRNAIKTDLSLLLECLKFQMKCPDLQKQALLTVHSICEKREHNVELLREMGGVAFLVNLSKSSIVHSDVKETVLFTLATLAEANIYCKNSLCRKEIFTDLADWLVKEDASLTKKRVIVYFLSVLVANNKSGQTLAQNTGCLDVLLNLFRITFPLSLEGIFKTANASHLHQLWSSVSTALCGCVNNPQNEEGQRVCVAVFPTVKTWFQQISLPQTDIFQPICSFIAMAVANNSCVQESFAASEGLEKLTLALIRFCLGSETSLLACQLAVSISKTLSACISDNPALASDLAKYHVVCHLFSLLINPKLEADDRLSVLLTMGHCTEASEEHQKQLVQIGSLPIIITLLTEDASEEVRKAATFILHTCKQATNTLGSHQKAENTDLPTDIDIYKKSEEELEQRIHLLEKRQAEAEQELAYLEQGSTRLPSNLAGSTPQEEDATESDDEPLIVRVNRNLNIKKMKKSCLEDQAEAGVEKAWLSAHNRTRALRRDSNVQRLDGAREPREGNSQPFKAPVLLWQNLPKDIYSFEEKEVRNETNNPAEEGSNMDIRCTGCVSRFDEVNSRTFASLQSSCTHSCDMHKVLKEATERYMSHHCSLLAGREHPLSASELTNPSSEKVSAAVSQNNQKNWRDVCLTPINKPSQAKGFQAYPWKRGKDVKLTPLHKGMKTEGPAFCKRMGPVLTPFKRPHPPEKSGEKNKRKLIFPDEQPDEKMRREPCSIRRKRKDFSHEEELHLLCGVKTHGPSWNTILWSYPFQPGRTNVDLAKKYRRLMKNKAQHAGLA